NDDLALRAEDINVGQLTTQLLDLLAEDSWLNVHAGELEVRPPPSRIEGSVGSAVGKHCATPPITLTTTRYLRQCSLGRDARAANKIGKTRIATNAVEVRVDVHFVRVHLEPAPDAGRLLRLRGDTIR